MSISIPRSLTASFAVLLCLAALPAFSADETSGTVPPRTEIQQLGDEVDILQFVASFSLTKDQVTQLAEKVAQLNARRQDYAKKEQAILDKIKTPLEQMKTALIVGKPAPESARAVADSGMNELEALKKAGWQEYEGFVASASKVLTSRQIRDIRRSPSARKRAGEMVQDIRFCSQDKYSGIRDKLVDELVEVKKIDKQEEWIRIGKEKLTGLTGDERAQALKELEQVKETDIAALKTEFSQLIDSIRAADSRILSVGVDRLASALRSDLEVNDEIRSMMMRILDSPTAESILKARAERMKDTAESG